MSSGRTSLLVGVLALATAGYFGLSALYGWKPLWREQEKAVAGHSSAASFDPTTGDTAVRDSSSEKAYGPLASSMDAQDAESPQPSHAPSAPLAGMAIDHVAAPDDDAPQHFLHKKFAVRDYHGFEFIVPAHAMAPKLQGKFKSFAQAGSAKVEVLLLNPQELNDLVTRHPGTFTFATDASNRGDVQWILTSPIFEAQKYYLIFRSSSGRFPITVDADFTISWE